MKAVLKGLKRVKTNAKGEIISIIGINKAKDFKQEDLKEEVHEDMISHIFASAGVDRLWIHNF